MDINDPFELGNGLSSPVLNGNNIKENSESEDEDDFEIENPLAKAQDNGDGSDITELAPEEDPSLQSTNARERLTKLLDKKSIVSQKLLTLERQIYALEGSYLQSTRNTGNIITGWDLYLSRGSGALKRQIKFKETDRWFSLSSATGFQSNGVEDPLTPAKPEGPEEGDDIQDKPYKIQKIMKKQQLKIL